MAKRCTINMITPDTKDWTCKVQVVDKSRPRDNKDKTTKYQVLILQDEEENQVQATIYSTDITYFEKEFAPFKTYLVSVAHVKVKPPQDPLPPPRRLALTTFDTFEYQPKEFEFDVLAILINGSPSTKTTTGKRIQEFIIMDKLIKTIETKLLSYKMKSTTPIGSIILIPFEDEVIFVANIQAQPTGQVFNVEAELSLASKDQRFSVLACSNCKQLFTRYNVRREIYCTSCHQSTHLIPRCQFEVTIKDNSGFATAIVLDEIAEKMLHLTSEEIYEICFVKVKESTMKCSNLLLSKVNAHNNIKETLSLQNVEDELNGKIFNIQIKRLFTKKLDAMQILSILSYLEKQDVIHKSMTPTTVNITDAKKRTIEHLSSREKEYPSMEMKNPPMKKN
ncbi:hypothetical protein H5410_016430 [Solanum commersonii]|uniref:Replication factor A C-terminal domain-containing protein n=1 Tax=Solanum commersonii TaxID=4109 RepID=A0A9J5ZWD3_SOLCO|nr:hypothetical protein H5410_016430 [Solanum commersonii]